jgi:DNA ligase 1
MKIDVFTDYLKQLDETTKRLEMTAILARMIEHLEGEEIKEAIYLSLGTLKAPFEDLKFNLADKQMIKVIASFSNTDVSKVNEMYGSIGDLGSVVYELNNNEKESKISLKEVYEELTKIAEIEGTGSQEKKASLIIALLIKLNKTSSKYIVRIILSNNRLGFTELTVLDALSQFLGNKKFKVELENAYNRFPDIGTITYQIKNHGIEGIKKIKIKPGVPILPQKAQRLGSAEEIIEKMGSVWCEYKFDGTRVQLHLDKNQKKKNEDNLFQSEETYLVKTFTRNLEETTHQYPDVIEEAKKYLKVDSVILDGEAIGFNPKTGEYLPFQETIQRKRKHNVLEVSKEIPLKYLVFDLLYLNGEETINLPLLERRRILDEIVLKGGNIEIDKHLETDQVSEVKDFFKESKRKNLEGIMVKKPDSLYEAGARAYSWIKFKREDANETADTLDVTVLGYYFGKGDRSEFGIGGFLVGIYDQNTNTYKSISKIGSGLSDQEWVKLREDCDKIKSHDKPKNYDVNKEMNCDVWVNPEIVVVVRADEITKSPIHTSGIALRFPRLMNFRTDKKPTDTTSVEEILNIYNLIR